ncbi:hypothetical protein CGRA01v4_08990 [Colletotrichum graminicola]|nr:hypothetical protein CGRA01v4_08990 [Colletotrichum graminicola]
MGLGRAKTNEANECDPGRVKHRMVLLAT